MATIRKDQVGAVYAHAHGTTYRLWAGDTVPPGVDIDPRFLDGVPTQEPTSPSTTRVKTPAGNASREAWAEFLTTQGITYSTADKQKDLRALWADHTAD